MRTRDVFCFLFLVNSFVSCATASVTVTGDTLFLTVPPSGVRKSDNLQGSNARVFRERGLRLSANLEVDVLVSNITRSRINSLDDIDDWNDSIGAGTSLSSFFLHIDSSNDESTNDFLGSVHFNRDILGVILQHGNGFTRLGATDSTLGSEWTIYPDRANLNNSGNFDLLNRNGNPPGDGTAIDFVRILDSNRTLRFNVQNKAKLDQLRILVANGKIVFYDQNRVDLLAPQFLPGPTNTILVDPMNPTPPITQPILQQGLNSAIQGQSTLFFTDNRNEFVRRVEESSRNEIEDHGAIRGTDYDYDNLDDKASFYALTLDDVDLGYIHISEQRDIFRQVVDQYFLKLPIGDYEKDGIVDSKDLMAWQDSYGLAVTSFSGADGDGDRRITGNDFLVWQRQLGKKAVTSQSTSATIPEPNAILLVCAGSLIASASSLVRTLRS